MIKVFLGKVLSSEKYKFCQEDQDEKRAEYPRIQVQRI